MNKVTSHKNHIIEKGDIYFFYRPKVKSLEGSQTVNDLSEIQRFYCVLHPEKTDLHRLLLVGKKHMPEVEEKEITWLTLEIATHDKKRLLEELKEYTYKTKTRGERIVGAARACGEGVYCLSQHEDHTHFSYILELPKEIDEVQEELKIEKEVSYIISVKNQQEAGITSGKAASFPKKLQEQFQGKRFIPIESADFMDYEGAELLLISTGRIDADKSLEAEHESIESADIFKELNLWKKDYTIKPLIEGKWI